jgi:hypothetical protein
LEQVDASLLHMKLLFAGVIWQFLFAMIVLYREEGNIRLSTIRRRFWLNHPFSAKTGETKKSLWWWIIPLIMLIALLEIGLKPVLHYLWTGGFGKWGWVAKVCCLASATFTCPGRFWRILYLVG